MAKHYIDDELLAAIQAVVAEYISRHRNDPPSTRPRSSNERPPNRRFKLTEALTMGGDADVVWRYRDPSSGDVEDSADTGTVYDGDGIFEAESGTCGRAELVIDGPSARWEIYQLGCEPAE